MAPGQMSQLRGRRYNRAKKANDGSRGNQHSAKDQNDTCHTAGRLAKEHGVSAPTIKRDGKFAEAVEKLKGMAAKAWRLSMLGWTQAEIGKRLGVAERTVRDDTGKNCHLAKIADLLAPDWNDKGVAELANRLNLSLTDATAAAGRLTFFPLTSMTQTSRMSDVGTLPAPPLYSGGYNLRHELARLVGGPFGDRVQPMTAGFSWSSP